MMGVDMREWDEEHQDYVNIVNENNVLIYLAQRGQIEAMKSLIEKNYDVNAADEDGQTAAYVAAKTNELEMLTMLADAGADLDANETMGPDLLYWAKRNENEEMIDFIMTWRSNKRGEAQT